MGEEEEAILWEEMEKEERTVSLFAVVYQTRGSSSKPGQGRIFMFTNLSFDLTVIIRYKSNVRKSNK